MNALPAMHTAPQAHTPTMPALILTAQAHRQTPTASGSSAWITATTLAIALLWPNMAPAQSGIGSVAIEKAVVQTPNAPLAAPESLPPTGAQAPAPVPAPAPATAPAPAPASCAELSEQATSADLKASTAQSQRRPAEQLIRLYDGVIDLWTRAAQSCSGRAQDRARRNLAENHRIRSTLAGMQGAEGAACNTATSDATALQELARQAFGERRWPDAAGLYRKAEDGWDMAAERCSGNQQQTAIARRDQAATDAHNAEHCAPTFELARTVTQRFRSESPGLATAERTQGSQQAETLWRNATDQCKGQAQDLARNNAKALERERGTPWVSTPLPVQEALAPARSRSAQTATALPIAPTTARALVASAAAATSATRAGSALPSPAQAAVAAVASVAATTPAVAALTPTATATAPTTLAAAAAAAAAPARANTMEELDILAGGTRFKGLFLRDQRTGVLTGRGRITWSNGDSYDGDIANSRRQGKGVFIWANGQSFDGEWSNDQPVGVASVRFANGNRYQGPTVNGMPEGKGVMQYASGDRYDGVLQGGVPHGEGTYRWANGQEYQGQWVNDLPQGKGRMKFTNGDVYEGAVEQGVATGSGRMDYASGDRYEGQVIKGTPNGKGTYLWKNGDRYDGDWKNGKKDGQGLFTWKNGDRWEGEFDEDDRVGKGTLTQAK